MNNPCFINLIYDCYHHIYSSSRPRTVNVRPVYVEIIRFYQQFYKLKGRLYWWYKTTEKIWHFIGYDPDKCEGNYFLWCKMTTAHKVLLQMKVTYVVPPNLIFLCHLYCFQVSSVKIKSLKWRCKLNKSCNELCSYLNPLIWFNGVRLHKISILDVLMSFLLKNHWLRAKDLTNNKLGLIHQEVLLPFGFKAFQQTA